MDRQGSGGSGGPSRRTSVNESNGLGSPGKHQLFSG